MLRNVVRLFTLSTIPPFLAILSFPNWNLSICAWFFLVPWMIALEGKTAKEAFWLSYLVGVIFWCGTIYWLVHVTLIGLIFLVLYLAIYFGLFGLFLRSSSIRNTPYAILTIPSLWVILEYLRSYLLTGFPWALLGYTQYLKLSFIQIADVTGPWGVSFLVVMVNCLIYGVMHRAYRVKHQKEIARPYAYAIPVFLLLLSFGYGIYKLGDNSEAQATKIKIAVIQGNIPQELKWQEAAGEFIKAKYAVLTKEAGKGNPDLIIWPEAASPAVFGTSESIPVLRGLRSLSKSIEAPLLIGVVRQENDRYFNSALLLSHNEGQGQNYDKIHLVPFGEYIPLRRLFPFLQAIVPIGDMAAGSKYNVFAQNLKRRFEKEPRDGLKTIRYSVLICFEDLFPELSRKFIKNGAEFLINITNDAWYKKTSAPFQHLQASVFRAVENRVFLARAANTGVSCFIDPHGKIISLLKGNPGQNIFIDGFLTEEISIQDKSHSFYSRHGDIFIFCLSLFMIYSIFFTSQRYSDAKKKV